MAILWKPTGSLDINTAPTDLPEQANGNAIGSGAMTRCKNLRLDRTGIAELRYGSRTLANFVAVDPPELILEVGGHRFIFSGDELWYDEEEVVAGVICPTPVFDIPGGAYAVDQTVTISCTLARAKVYYTLDKTVPSAASTLYTTPVLVPGFSWLKAIAIDPLGYLYDSELASAYYLATGANTISTDTNEDALVTETTSDTLTTEGT
jgi:hypothetical protein